jgi:predicted enzyme related to lactoylglutathione lyase
VNKYTVGLIRHYSIQPIEHIRINHENPDIPFPLLHQSILALHTRNNMKKATLMILIIATSFLSGFAFKAALAPDSGTHSVSKVTGIGGIFFKCKDPGQVREWYKTHLGLNVNKYGAVFEWYQGADSTRKGFTQWSPFGEKTKYFEPSAKDFMINYRVNNLPALVAELKTNGVTILDTVSTYDYGKFVHILDIEGNKLELWEPNDVAYEQMGRQIGAETTK